MFTEHLKRKFPLVKLRQAEVEPDGGKKGFKAPRDWMIE